MAAEILGIDIGGSGIKGAPVDVAAGRFTRPRLRLPTPHPPKPDAVAAAVGRIATHFAWRGPVGVTFPGVVVDGVTRTAANMHRSWIGVEAGTLFEKAAGSAVTVLNDADAAGLAEMRFGAGRDQPGVVLVLTFGTGIGSALFLDGRLLPNTELGHIEIRGKDAERRASAQVREARRLSWREWATRVGEYLDHVDRLLWPSLIVVGGGVSRRADKFLPLLGPRRARVVAAALHNDAGIVGAALAAAGA